MGKEELNLCLIEYNPLWENSESNLDYLSNLLKINKGSDIYILPEMFTTGFSQNASKISETMKGKSIQWMKDFSSSYNTAICGSLSISDQGKYYNRFVFISKGEILAVYDKHHLFTYGGESKIYTSGNQKVCFEYLGWKISPMICYDLRFPVWLRNVENYDLLINVANWPSSRIDAWDTLLKARAIENMAFICEVNRKGKDGNTLEYNGHSAVYSPTSMKISPTSDKECLKITITYSTIKNIRTQYPFLEDRDNFELE